MLANMFKSHGEFCADHPWEVIVGVLTLTACVLSIDNNLDTCRMADGLQLKSEDTNSVDVIFMTIVRCSAILYTYYQFCKLRRLGSPYILGIAGLFIVFSSFVFSSTVINFLRRDLSDLKDALFFFLLVIDLTKASLLAQLALYSASPKEVNKNIARGMSLLGPTLTLDTLVGTLVISVGTLSGVKRLEMLCYFACFSFIINYVIFMTFYPACLSLILELSNYGTKVGQNQLQDKSYFLEFLNEEGQKPNPVVQRVKVIMSAGMMIVHAHSRWTLNTIDINENNKILPVIKEFSPFSGSHNETDTDGFHQYFMRVLAMSTDHIVILILVLALIVKFVFFDDKDNVAEHILSSTSSKIKGYHLLTELQNRYHSNMKLENKLCQTEQSLFSTYEHKNCQTNPVSVTDVKSSQAHSTDTSDTLRSESTYSDSSSSCSVRSEEECYSEYQSQGSAASLSDGEVRMLVKKSLIRSHQLESAVQDPQRGISIRRTVVAEEGKFAPALENLPFRNFDYSKVIGACCENVIGYIPVPLGVTGPLLLDGCMYHVPMATTEGCLVASTNRGCRALLESGGVSSRVVTDGMTRGPVVRFSSVANASEAMIWMNDPKNFDLIKENFDCTSRFARLQKILVRIAGRHLFIRFSATTGDAMGMNMLSKGTETALKFIQKYFNDMEILSLSGNFCTDKKPSAVNWIEGRGKGVVCEGIIPERIVKSVLKTTAHAMVDVNISKNMVGSAIAGSIGGFNAHAANIVTAIFIATGQDPAQNVGSSNCMTLMEACGEHGKDLYVSCTMPSIEIGTVGGGTSLPAQSACLEMLGVKGSHPTKPGENAKTLARIVCGTVLAGELSLMAALTAGHLVQSHLKYNRTSLSSRKSAVDIAKSLAVDGLGTCISH